jgi:hypothetical protein
MRLTEYFKASGQEPYFCECDKCNKPAEIEWDCAQQTYCRRCARDFALGLLRDVVACEVGEKHAQEEYVKILAKYDLIC